MNGRTIFAGLVFFALILSGCTQVPAPSEALVSSQQMQTQTSSPTPAATSSIQSIQTPTPTPIPSIPVGTVWAWGSLGASGLGDGTQKNSKIPVQVKSLNEVVEISTSGYHAVALKKDGTVWAWGLNSMGQVGDGTTANKYEPVKVSGLADVVSVAAGGDWSIAAKSDGSVWVWGSNALKKINPDAPKGIVTTPVKLSLTGVKFVRASESMSFAVKNDGSVWQWGEGFQFFSVVPGLTGVKDITPNYHALKTDGTVVTFSTNINSVTPVYSLSDVVFISGGKSHALAVKADGTVWAWGTTSDGTNNLYGQLGDGTNTVRTSLGIPTQVAGISDAIAVGAGSGHSLALKKDGTVWAWGYNYYGQLGNGTDGQNSNKYVPTQVSGLTGVTLIDGGKYASFAVSSHLAAITDLYAVQSAELAVLNQRLAENPNDNETIAKLQNKTAELQKLYQILSDLAKASHDSQMSVIEKLRG